METARSGIADVHTRALAHMLQVGEMLQILGRVGLPVARLLRGFIVFLFVGHLVRSCLLLVIRTDSPQRSRRTQRRIYSRFIFSVLSVYSVVNVNVSLFIRYCQYGSGCRGFWRRAVRC